MSAKHTEGPWFASDEDGEVYSLSDYSSVAMVLMNEQGKANARLIAAAPDILEALRDLVSACTRYDEQDEHSSLLAANYCAAKDGAIAAIAKAEGTQ